MRRKKINNYKIHLIGVKLEFQQQLEIYHNINKLFKSLPTDGKVILKLSKKYRYKADIHIFSSTFGCNIKTSSKDLEHVISKVFRKVEEEIQHSQKSAKWRNELAPYFGGYPAYYAEGWV